MPSSNRTEQSRLESDQQPAAARACLDFRAICDGWFAEVMHWISVMGGPESESEDLVQPVSGTAARVFAMSPAVLAVTAGMMLLVACAGASSSGDHRASAGETGVDGNGGLMSLAGATATTNAGGVVDVPSAGGAPSGGAPSTGGVPSAGVSGNGTIDLGGAGAAAGNDGVAGNATGGAGGNANSGPPTQNPILSVCPNCKAIFNGVSLDGWVQLPAASWSVVNGALHSLGTARGVLYSTSSYGDFRFIFLSRLVKDPAMHLPCVLFWGDALTKDALSALQVQPPNGYMWDYRSTGPTANKSPDVYEKRFGHPAMTDAEWSQCEMLGNQAAGSLRLACCQVTGTARCKAAEVVDFKDATAGRKAPLALQVHNAGMIEEFKDLYVESPVSEANTLVTTQ